MTAHHLDSPAGRRLSAALVALGDHTTLGVARERVERAILDSLAVLEYVERDGEAPEHVTLDAWRSVSTLNAAARGRETSRAVENALALGAVVVARALREFGVRPWQVRLVRPEPGGELGDAILRAEALRAERRSRPHGPPPRVRHALEGPELIAAAIEASGLSASAFARDVLGVTDRSVRYWQDGTRPLTGTPAKLCRAIVADPSVVDSLRGV